MNFIGLTKCAEIYLATNQTFCGVYETTLADGAVTHLRVFRDTKMPVTCSSGGVTEVVQEYINGSLFTCLVPSSKVEAQDRVVGDWNGIPVMNPHPDGQTIQYAKQRELWVQRRPISVDGAWFSWVKGVLALDGQYVWAGFDWWNGIISEDLFKKKEETPV